VEVEVGDVVVVVVVVGMDAEVEGHNGDAVDNRELNQIHTVTKWKLRME
jgi:hypothetical protein